MEKNVYNEFTKTISKDIVRQVMEDLKLFYTTQTPLTSNDVEYLTREEVASLCKVKSLSTLWSWRKKKLLIPTSKAGRKPLYLKSEVLAFLDCKEGGQNV